MKSARRAPATNKSQEKTSTHVASCRIFVSCCSITGLSAASLLVLNGDILGFSGLMTSVGLNLKESFHSSKSHWKLVWLSTFMLTVNFYVNHVEDATRDHRLETSGEVPIASTVAHVLGGALVGLGTKMGNGCTSGHGVCGLARMSRRSMVAVPIFMAFSMITAATINVNTPWSNYTAFLRTDTLPAYSKMLGTVATSAVVSLGLLRQTTEEPLPQHQRKVWGSAVSAVFAALGLVISGMTRKSKVNDFLDISTLIRAKEGGGYGLGDPTLIAVMGSAVTFSWLGYQFVPGWAYMKKFSRRRSLVGDDFAIPTSTTVDAELVTGAALFGIGWGLTGLCPGPALYHAAAGMSDVILAWFPGFFAGAWAGTKIKEYMTEWQQQKMD